MEMEKLKRKIIHIDMDAFYASIEQRDNPEYRGKPLAVGGSPQGRGGLSLLQVMRPGNLAYAQRCLQKKPFNFVLL